MSAPLTDRKTALVACLLLAGCESQVLGQATWQAAIETHTCTVPQMDKVQSEAAWCTANTQYYSTYCYGTAIIRNCEARKL